MGRGAFRGSGGASRGLRRPLSHGILLRCISAISPEVMPVFRPRVEEEFRTEGSDFRDQGLTFEIWDLGFGICELGFGVQDKRFRVWES